MSKDLCKFYTIEYVKFQFEYLKFLDKFNYFEEEATSQSCDSSFPLNGCHLHLTLKSDRLSIVAVFTSRWGQRSLLTSRILKT